MSTGAESMGDRLRSEAFAELVLPFGVDEFLDTIWQREPRVLRSADALAGKKSTGQEGVHPVLSQTWADCCDLLHLAWLSEMHDSLPDGCDFLVFKDGELTRDYDPVGPCAALLDGCSCVVNHAEYVWPAFLRLCRQLRSRLLHVYANTYITPTNSQAVRAHADDRDVFVLQLQGTKHWRVYNNPPIEYPYSDEQVGKHGLAVPSQVLNSPPLMEVVLQPGEVLYMPRGFVHEARCTESSSWHATLAVATHDWSWAKVFGQAAASALNPARWRMAVPLSLGLPDGEEGRAADAALAETELAALVDCLREDVNVRDMQEVLSRKLVSVNRQQDDAANAFQGGPGAMFRNEGGYLRCRQILAETRVRKTTPEEMRMLMQERKGKGGKGGKGYGKAGKDGKDAVKGVMVRNEISNAALSTLRSLRCRKGKGALVSELSEECEDKDARAFFDQLMQICFARVCVTAGAFRVIGQPGGGGPIEE